MRKKPTLTRPWLWLLPLVCLSGCTSTDSTTTTPDKHQPYNVLFISVDDLRPELNCYGASHIVSPNIDGLAAGGVLFERAYCQQAVCSPSRTSLLTGLRPDSTQVFDLTTHFRSTVPEVVTLPQHFREQGYFTTSIGKIYHNGTLDDEASWSEPNWYPKSVSPRGYLLPENQRIAAAHQGRGPATEMADQPDSLYQDFQIASQAIQTLGRVKDQPFFLAVGFLKPHLPFVAPKKYWDLYPQVQLPPNRLPQVGASRYASGNFWELRSYPGMPQEGFVSEEKSKELIRGYYACTSFMDAQVGRVLEELKRLGLDQNTIVVLWGDHGYKLGEYSDWCKHSNVELDTRSPLIVRAPQLQTAGQKTKALVEFVDVYPTLCELAGLPVPEHLQGYSLAPLLRQPDQPWKEGVLSQYPRNQWPSMKNTIMGYSLRTDRYRFTSWQLIADPQQVLDVELYDHQTDPGETVNVAKQPAYAQVVRQLSRLLAEKRKTGFVPPLAAR